MNEIGAEPKIILTKELKIMRFIDLEYTIRYLKVKVAWLLLLYSQVWTQNSNKFKILFMLQLFCA